jgi:serine/threonine-protein kinase
MGPVAAVVAVVAVVAFAAWRLAPRPGTAPIGGTTAAAPLPLPAIPAPKPRATLHVETDPPGAKVNEEGETLCAATPCDIVYVGEGADPGAEHLLAFLLPGYKLERKVAPMTGSPVSVKLTKAR